MNARALGRFICLSMVFFMMGGAMASAKDMPERPTWNDVRQELNKIKHHPKPAAADKKVDAEELKKVHPGVKPIHHDAKPIHHDAKPIHHDAKPIHHDIKPIRHDGKMPPALDPRAAKPSVPGHAKAFGHDKGEDGKMKKEGPKGKDHPNKMVHPMKKDHPKKMPK